MPRFSVLVTRSVQYDDTIEFDIEAESEEEAREQALTEAHEADDWDQGMGVLLDYEVDVEEIE